MYVQSELELNMVFLNFFFQVKGNRKNSGICNECMNSLQKWHIFRKTILERHEASRNTGAQVINEPVAYGVEESKMYRNYRRMGKGNYRIVLSIES